MKKTITYRDAIHRAMYNALLDNPYAVIMGQGVSDPTRIFGTTKGLVEKFGSERVIDTPIAEDSTTGIGIGAALNGLYPIQTHIRVDFLIIAMNQIVNLLAKYKYMYGSNFCVPMLIRAVVGRSWGQGPQHSQSLQALFGHIPGLMVIMPSTASEVMNSYYFAVHEYKSPVISIEHRFLYDMIFRVDEKEKTKYPFSARIVKEGNDVTIVATSYMVHEAQRAANWVHEKKDIKCEIIDLHVISDLDHEQIYKSVSKTGRLIVADTGWLPYGVCAEVCRGIAQIDPGVLKQPVIQLGMKHTPCPTSHALEDLFYPDMGSIVDAVYTLVFETKSHGMELPSKHYIRKQRIPFKGPF